MTDTAPQYCLPTWHPRYQALPKTIVRSGCSTVDGNVQCDPQAMADHASSVIGLPVSLATYGLARYMQSEVGDGSVEERVAVGEAAVNRANMEDLPHGILSLLLYRQGTSNPHYGYFGPIHGPSGVTTAPYGRWAATSADPSVQTLALAGLVLSGGSDNFSQGADDQDGIEYSAAFPDIPAKIRRAANAGNYWVGPLPGVDHWRTFLWRHYGYGPNSAEGLQLIQRALDATAHRVRPDWSKTPVCSGMSSSAKSLLVGAGLVGLAGLAYVFVQRVRHGVT